MPKTVTEISVFIASPGDVAKERRALDAVANEINRTVGSAEGFRLVIKKWETRARPAAGRPQGVINQQLGPSDIFVGIMWKRFGTPTGKAGSGTEEEFNEAYAQWKRKRKHKPEIMFYSGNKKKKTTKKTAKPKHRLPKVRRRLTDADRSRYLSRGFTNVKRYFREGTQDINAHVRGARASVQELEDGSLFVEVTSGGQVINRAHVSKRDGAGWDRGIAFSQGTHLDPHYATGWNEFARLEESEGQLSFQLPRNIYSLESHKSGSKPKQVFQHFWELFIEGLEK